MHQLPVNWRHAPSSVALFVRQQTCEATAAGHVGSLIVVKVFKVSTSSDVQRIPDGQAGRQTGGQLMRPSLSPLCRSGYKPNLSFISILNPIAKMHHGFF